MAISTKKPANNSAQPIGSWGRFAKRIHIPTCRRNENRRQTEDKDNIWLYVSISVVYFFLIGLVLLILLLAPKFRHTQRHHDLNHHNPIGAESQDQLQIQSANIHSTFEVTEETFKASPKDPIMYAIDPRSSIFRGDYAFNQKNDLDDRLRINSKFLQV